MTIISVDVCDIFINMSSYIFSKTDFVKTITDTEIKLITENHQNVVLLKSLPTL